MWLLDFRVCVLRIIFVVSLMFASCCLCCLSIFCSSVCTHHSISAKSMTLTISGIQSNNTFQCEHSDKHSKVDSNSAGVGKAEGGAADEANGSRGRERRRERSHPCSCLGPTAARQRSAEGGPAMVNQLLMSTFSWDFSKQALKIKHNHQRSLG